MKERIKLLTMLSIAAMMFLSLFTTQVQAQTYSGQAVGTQSTTSVQVGTAPAVVTAVVAARLADTGPLPPQGGMLTGGPVAAAGVALGTAPVTGTLNAAVIATSTSGGNGTSQSQASVANLNLGVGGTLRTTTITADAITTNTNCVCGTAGATCTGTTNVANLVITRPGLATITLNGSVAPNTFTTTASTDIGIGSARVRTTTTVTIIVNEQTRTPDGGNTATDNITVNGLRVIVTESVQLGNNGVITTTTSETIIAQSYSDINCAAAALTDLQTTKICGINNNVITCLITVTNAGFNAATNVVVSDPVPANTTFVSATPTGGFVLNTPPVGSGPPAVITGTLATLAAGGSATITTVFNVAPGTPAGTAIANTATTTSDTGDPVPGNNSGTGTVTTTGVANGFSGRAVGVDADVTVLGLATVSTTVSDTGPLPVGGGSVSATLANANIGLGGTNLTAQVVSSTTSGGGNSSQSQAGVNNLVATILGIPITAAVVQANSSCTCGATPVCSGSTTIANLAIAGAAVTVTGAANQTINIPGGLITVIINEQIVTPNSITVNAIHIIVNAPGVLVADIIIAQAYSDINCGGTVPPTPTTDLQTTKECVNNNNLITCTITVTNNGPNPAFNIQVTDPVPTNTTFFSASQTGGFNLTLPAAGSGPPAVITGTLATLASGASATITTVFEVNPGVAANTTITNTATTTSTNDSTPGNNTGTGTVITLPPATGFSGRAVGIDPSVTVGGVLVLDATVGDTGFLPPAGGSISPAPLIGAGVNLPGVVSAIARIITVSTSGNGNASQSQAQVTGLTASIPGFIDIGNATGTLNVIQANSNCVCTANGPSCTGNTTLTNVIINGVVVDVTATSPIVVTVNTGLITGTVSIFINEQTSTAPPANGANITVNALRINLNLSVVPVVGGPAIPVTGDIIVAQAYSDIVCGSGPPTAADVSISGRVLSTRGRGISNVFVTITNQNGVVQQTARTNSFGYYNFAAVEAGEIYFVNASSKRYRFDTQTITPTQNLAEVNFVALPSNDTNVFLESREK